MTENEQIHLLHIEGSDATRFAHAQFSSDVATLPLGQWQFSAWLTPQGRVRHLFQLAKLNDDAIVLLLRGGEATSMSTMLGRFIFRERVTLRAEVRILTGAAAQPIYSVISNAQSVSFGCGDHAMCASLVVSDTDQQNFFDSCMLRQIALGWPWLPDNLDDDLLGTAISLMRLNAASLDKGCYPGQEIIARLHYRGGSKRHLHHIKLSHPCRAGSTLRLHNQQESSITLLQVVKADDEVHALAVMTDAIVKSISGLASGADFDGVAVWLLASWPD